MPLLETLLHQLTWGILCRHDDNGSISMITNKETAFVVNAIHSLSLVTLIPSPQIHTPYPH